MVSPTNENAYDGNTQNSIMTVNRLIAGDIAQTNVMHLYQEGGYGAKYHFLTATSTGVLPVNFKA